MENRRLTVRPVRIALLATLSCLALLATATAASADLKLGFSLKRLASRSAEDAAFQAVAPSMDRVLTAVHWVDVQPDCRAIRRGDFEWTAPDDAMRRIAARDLTVIVTLKDGPECTQTDKADNPSKEWVPEYARFARELVDRYGPGGSFEVTPLRQVEVWSEPNLKSWAGGPGSYAKAFVETEHQIRKGSRRVDAVVGGPGFCCRPEVFLKELFEKREFRRVADVVGLHTYGKSPRYLLGQLDAVRKVVPKSSELVITEHGWSTCPAPSRDYNGKCQTPEGQASKMREYVTKLRQRARRLDLTGFYWFQAQDFASAESVAECPKIPKDFYGIYDHAGQPKPSLEVWEQLTGAELPDAIAENKRERGCENKEGLRSYPSASSPWSED